MLKNILVFTVLMSNIYASTEIPWIYQPKQAFVIAKKYHIPIMVFIYKDGCRWCEKSISHFQNPHLINALSSGDIIPVALNSTEVAKISFFNINVSSYPAYYFFSENKQLLSNPLMGYVEPLPLSTYIQKIANYYKNYVNQHLKN